jgi:ubiquinone/menaquinone biosynthesis C-methylase UbiE
LITSRIFFPRKINIQVLEIGCAEGWMSKLISKKANILFSCDIAMSYLQRAKKRGINANFARIDAHCLPFPENLFDCVVITEVLEHLIAPYRALEEIHRILKPNAILIISVPNNLNFSNLLMSLWNRLPQCPDLPLFH